MRNNAYSDMWLAGLLALLLSSQGLYSQITPDKSINSKEQERNFSLFFNGIRLGSIVRIPFNPSQNSYLNTHQVTFEAWIKPTRSDTGGVIINKAVGMCHDDWVLSVVASLTPHFRLANSCTGNNRFVEVLTGIRAGHWHHLAGVWDGDSIRLFINGRQVRKGFYSGVPSANDIDMSIGANNHWDGDYISFKGYIDEVRYSNVARYKTDFTPSFRLGNDSNTVFLYHFDEGKGTVLYDSSAQHIKAYGEHITWSTDTPDRGFKRQAAVRIPKTTAATEQQSPSTSIMILSVSGLLAMIFAYVYWKKRNRGKTDKTIVQGLSSTNVAAEERDRIIDQQTYLPRPSRIHVFGEFQVIDNVGKDISNAFSSRIRQLLLIILLHSDKDGKGTEGITTDKLTGELWPDADPQSAKNSRGVSMNRLRNLLTQVGDVVVRNHESRWTIETGSGVYCDYFEFQKLLTVFCNNENMKNTEGIQAPIDILQRGSLLRGESYKWLDGFQIDMTNKVIALCFNMLENHGEDLEPEVALSIANLVLQWESLNEEGLRYKTKVLSKLGRHSAAKAAYDAFVSEYSQIMGKPYNLALTELLS